MNTDEQHLTRMMNEGVTLPKPAPSCTYCHEPMHPGGFETHAESFATSTERRREHDRGELGRHRSAASEALMAVRERNIGAAFEAVSAWHFLTLNNCDSNAAWGLAMCLKYGAIGCRTPDGVAAYLELRGAEIWRKLQNTLEHYLAIGLPFKARDRGVPEVCAEELAEYQARCDASDARYRAERAARSAVYA